MLDKVERDLEYKPEEARQRTAGVNPTQVLKD